MMFLPTLIAQYQLQLPDRKLIQAKLHELLAGGREISGLRAYE